MNDKTTTRKYFGYTINREIEGYFISDSQGQWVGFSPTLKQAQAAVKDHLASISAHPTVTQSPVSEPEPISPLPMDADKKTTLRRQVNRALDAINTLRTKFVYYKIEDRVIQVAMHDETIPIGFEQAHVVDYSEYLAYRATLRYNRRHRERKAGTFVRHGKRIKR